MLSFGHFYTKPVSLPEDKEVANTTEAPLVGIDVHVELLDYCVQVKQTQRFRNNEESPLEVTFEFELPKGCAVSSFTADVGDRHLTGKVEEKQKAAEKYDDALAAGHSAAMLMSKKEDPNDFVLQLGNVAPGLEAFVTVTYERLAALVEDKIVLTLDGSDARNVIFADPPAKTPENDARVRPGFHFVVHVATQTPLKSISSPSHPIIVELGSDGALVRLAESADWRENKNFVLEAAVADPHLPSVRLQKSENAEVAMLSFYPRIDTPQTKCEMIFVLDRSGSMSGRAIECAKNTLQFFLRSLPEDAYFNILSFGSNFVCFKPESVPFNDDTLQEATIHVNSFKADLGGTDIYSPLDCIFKQPSKPGYPRQVFILTDGEIDHKELCIDLVKQNVNTTRLFAFGIGLYVDKELVDGMARAGEGISRLISDNSNICESVMKELEHALQPGLTDIHITWKDSATGELINVRQTPQNPPQIFRGSRLVSFAILPDGCKACKAVLTGSFGDKEYISEVDVDPVAGKLIAGEQIIKLGVRSLIEDIQNGCGGIPSDQKDEIKKAVIELSVKHGVLSKYTAFIAIGTGGEALETSMVCRRVSRRNDYEMDDDMDVALGAGCMDYCCDEDELLEELDELEEEDIEYELGVPPSASRVKAVPCPDEDDDLAELEMALTGDGDYNPTPARSICSKPAEPVVAQEPTKSLENVIIQQKASGCFNVLALQLLDIPISAMDARPTVLPEGMDAKLAEDIWITLLVLSGLEKRYGDRKSEWSFLAKKGEKWANNKLGSVFDVWRSAAETAFK